MTAWLAGMEITADRLNDFTATETTSGVVDSSGFATSSFVGRKVSGFTYIELFTNRTGATISEAATNTGNISPDVSVATLPSGYRPQESINCICGNGSVDGEATIGTDGVITLRSISGNSGWANGTNLRFTAVWCSENN